MMLISEITLSIKPSSIHEVIRELVNNGCRIKNVHLLEQTEKDEKYSMEILYYNRVSLKRFIDIIRSSPDRYKIISVINSLDNDIRGGLIDVSGKMKLEKTGDYEIGVLGAHDLILEKIENGSGADYSGIFSSAGIIGLIKDSPENSIALQKAYSLAERDAVIINRFTHFNAIPHICTYREIEDLYRNLRSLEKNYRIIRVSHFSELDIQICSQISDELAVPVIFHQTDEVPLYLLSVINKIAAKNGMAPGETTIGIAGIDSSSLRLVNLLGKSGYTKILGYDPNDRAMLKMESLGGLATIPDNIFGNADILLISGRDIDSSMYELLRPGQLVISCIDSAEMPVDLINSKGIRECIFIEDKYLLMMMPGLLMGLCDSGMKNYDDDSLIKLAGKISSIMSDIYTMPDIFSNIHDRISEIVSGKKKPAGN